MTDRIKGLIVTLDDDYREDDVQRVVDAIQMIKCVLTVAKSVTNIDDHMARHRVRDELTRKMLGLLKDPQEN